MEDPLISEESGSTSFAAVAAAAVMPRGLLRRNKPPPDRFDAISYGSKYQKAATLVDLAEDGVGLPEEVLDDSDFGKAAKFYFIYIRLDFLWSLNLFALILLNFLEKPLWCDALGKSVCEDRNFFYLGQLPYLTGLESLIFEVVTLLILFLNTFFPIIYEGLKLYRKNNLNILKVISLLLLLVDLLVYLSSAPGFLPFRVAPYIRIILVVLNIRELRSCMVTLGGMMSMYLNILAIWSLFIVFSSWMAYVIFEDTEQGRTVFNSFHETLYQMFVLFTTSNNPDVWIPGYKKSRWSCIFFILYVLIGVYFLTNLILAVVYDCFKAQLAKQVLKMDTMRNRILERAFRIIDTENTGNLDKEQCIHLFEELNNYRSLPKISSEDYELIFNELDDSGDFQINLSEFTDLCDAIALKFEKEPSPPWLEYWPSFYHWGPVNSLKAFVISPMFEYVVAFVLLLNVVTVVIETTLDIQNSSGQKIWQEVEFVFGWIYVLEMALKIFSLGLSKYWMDGQNQFDFVVTWIIVIGETISLFFPDMLPFLSNGEWIRYLLIARMLRLVRLLKHVGQCRAFVATFLSLIPSLMPYLGTVFCLMCIYCTLGVQVFGGLVNAGNPKVAATDLSDNDYLLFNFNDYPNGMVTLFNLLVMGNWQAWMQSYKDLTGTYWTLVYFISFYLIAILLLLNLIVAFVLEAFQAEIDHEESEGRDNDDELARKRRRCIGIKTRNRIVDNILHRILSDQLQK